MSKYAFIPDGIFDQSIVVEAETAEQAIEMAGIHTVSDGVMPNAHRAPGIVVKDYALFRLDDDGRKFICHARKEIDCRSVLK